MTIEIHPLADVQTRHIGSNTRIGQYCVVLPGAKIGSDCNIYPQVFIENDVIIGKNVTVKNGVTISRNAQIEDNVNIAPNVTLTSDLYPHSNTQQDKLLQIVIKAGASIGANAIILPGVKIAEGAMVGAGAVVSSSVPTNAIVVGNPARIVGYTNTSMVKDVKSLPIPDGRKPPYFDTTAVRGVTIHKFPLIPDMRGSLTVGEFEQHIPFMPKRYFMVFDVPSIETRGEHAHKTCHQFLICLRGSCTVMADDGVNRAEAILDSPDKGFYLPPMVWGVQYKYTHDALLLVFASEHYDADDYIRSYSEFIKLANA